LSRLDAVLSQLGAAGLIRVLLIHHPPLPGMVGWHRGLHDAAALRDILKRVGAELVLHGHEHSFTLNRLSWAGGVMPIVGVPSASAAASASRLKRNRIPTAAYHLYRISRGAQGCVIKMTRRGLLPGGARVGTLDETWLCAPSDRSNTHEVLSEDR